MKLSVITVVYNGEKTIERTVQSVIDQKNAEIEYIIVDGGSTDSTMDRIDRYRENISHIISGPDNGIYDAMNKGSRLATGDIIAFLNSDDWYEKDILQYVIKEFENSETDLLCGDANVVNEYGNKIRKAQLNRRAIFRNLPASHQAVFARREWMEKIGGFCTEYRVSADFEWVTRSLVKGCRIAVLPMTVVNVSAGGFSEKHAELSYQEIKEIAFRYYTGTGLEADMRRYYAYREFIYTGKKEEWESADFSGNGLKINLPKEKNIYIFGMGKVGKECYRLLEKLGYEVAGFMDNHPIDGQAEYMGRTVRRPERMQAGADYAVIASSKYENDMRKQMEGQGFCKGRDFGIFTEIRDKIIYG